MYSKSILPYFLFASLLVAVCTEYVDPKKIMFNFYEDFDAGIDEETTDNRDEGAFGGPGAGAQKDCVPSEKLKKCVTDKKSLCDQVLVFLDKIDRFANPDAIQQVLTFDLSLTRSDLVAIKRALRSKDCAQDASLLLTRFQSHNSWKTKLMDSISDVVVEHKLLISITTITLSIFLLFTYWVYISRSWLYAALKIFVLVFIGSVVMTYVRNYKKHLAHNLAKQEHGIPLSCRVKDQTVFDSFWYLLRSKFSVMQDDCEQYYEAMIIDPILQYTFVEAISETFSRLVLTPLPIFFEYIGNSILKLFQILPSYLSVPMMAIILFVIVIQMFLSKRYRFRSLLFSIEPADPASVSHSIEQNKPAIGSSSPLTRSISSPVKKSLSFVRDQIEVLPVLMSGQGDGFENVEPESASDVHVDSRSVPDVTLNGEETVSVLETPIAQEEETKATESGESRTEVQL